MVTFPVGEKVLTKGTRYQQIVARTVKRCALIVFPKVCPCAVRLSTGQRAFDVEQRDWQIVSAMRQIGSTLSR